MKADEVVRIQNEVFTQIVIEELQRQKVSGKAIREYVLDKHLIDALTTEKVKKILQEG